MSGQTISAANATRLTAGDKTRSKFFILMAGILLLIVLAGFSPTLYFRSYFDVPTIPTYLLVHGGVLTTWFVWLFIQTSLVATHRTNLHRRFGIIGVGIGVAVLVASGAATLGMGPRLIKAGFDVDANIALLALGVWMNLAMAINFSVLLTLAIVYRRQSEIHKRLMLLASINIAGPALARFGRFPEVGEGNPKEAVFLFGGLLVLLLVLVVYDKFAQKRLHPVTMWGAPFVLVLPLVLGFLIGNTSFGQSVVLLLN
jgi:hypothetical protein